MKRIVGIWFCIALLAFSAKSQIYFNQEYTNDSSDNSNAAFIHQMVDTSGYFLVGAISMPGNKVYLRFIRIDNYGDTIWTKLYRSRPLAQSMTLGDYVQNDDTSMIFVGIYAPQTSDSMKVNLFKVDTAGNVLWDYIYGDAGRQTPPFDIAKTKDNGYIITGWTSGWGASTNAFRTFLLKLDSLGTEEWHKIYFLPPSTSNAGTNVDTTNDNGFIISGVVNNGSTQNDMYVMRTDSAGNQIWLQIYGGPNYDVNQSHIKNIGNNEYIFAGGYRLDLGNGENVQYYLAKLDGLGNTLWADTSGIDQSGSDEAFTSTPIITTNEDIVLVGSRDPGIGIEATVLSYDKNGNKLWERTFNQYGSNNQNYLWDIHQTFDEGFIACGDFTNISAFEQPLWALKLDSMGCEIPNCSVGIDKNSLQQDDVVIYPNPTHSTFNIALNEQPKPNTIFKLFDITGKQVYSQSLKQSITSVDVCGYPKGVYIYKIVNNNETYSGKLVVD